MLLVVGLAWAVDPPGTELSRRALARCAAADAASDAERPVILRESLALADRAIEADEHDALAHFAAFCALGRQLRIGGLSLAAPLRLRRLRREVDRTLELAPDFPDALAGKGSLLVNLPRVLGGDVAEGERLLRRAIELDPNYLMPRLALADVLRDRGERTEARAQAARALEIAEKKGDRDDADAARAALRALDDAPAR